LVYESLARLRVNPKDEKSRSWADQVVLISSVSGGSLASAYFSSQSFPVAQVRPMRDWQHSITREIQDWLPKKAKQFREKLQVQAEQATEKPVQESLELDIEQWKLIEKISQDLAKLSTEDRSEEHTSELQSRVDLV